MKKQYRTYETYRNDGGGLDPCGTDWEYVEAANAREAATIAAAKLRGVEDCEDIIIMATDDDGDSATAEV